MSHIVDDKNRLYFQDYPIDRINFMAKEAKLGNFKSYQCKIEILENIFEKFNINIVDLAVIDVEGSEGRVILGMKNLIKRSRPVIFIECSKNGRENVWKVLKDLNYHCFNSKDVFREILDIDDYRSDDFLWITELSN